MRFSKSTAPFCARPSQYLCPKDLGIQFDDIEREARLRLRRAIRAEREINFLLIRK